MSVGAAALLLAAIGQGGADAPPPVVHEQRLDDVGAVSIGPDATKLTVAHKGLPAGSFAEVTDLISGRTIIVLVEGAAPAGGSEIGQLSAGAARALGVGAGAIANVRLRPAVPSPAEQAAVRSGTVISRLDAPAPLLTALRRRLSPPTPVPQPAPPPVTVATPAPKPTPAATVMQPPRPKPAPAKSAPVAAAGRWFVQVATLSDAARAAALAKSVGGVVRRAGRLYRVQAGPFATRAAAETARASIARRGFGDARTIAQD